MNFLAPAFLAGARRDRHSGDHSFDQPGAESRRRVPVADVPAAHSVSVGAPAEDPASAAARFSGASRSRCSSPRLRARSSSAASSAITGSGARELVILLDRSSSMGYADRWTKAKDAAKKAVSGLSATRSRDADVFAGDASVASEPMATPDRIIAAINATKLSSEGDALRSGAQAGVADHFRVDSAAPGSGAHLRLPEGRLGESQRDHVPSRHDDHASRSRRRGGGGRRRVAGDDEPRQRRRARSRHRRGAIDQHWCCAEDRVGDAGDRRSRRADEAGAGRRRAARSRWRSRPIAVPSGATKGAVRITPDSLTQDDVLSFTIAPGRGRAGARRRADESAPEPEAVPESRACDRRSPVVSRR